MKKCFTSNDGRLRPEDKDVFHNPRIASPVRCTSYQMPFIQVISHCQTKLSNSKSDWIKLCLAKHSIFQQNVPYDSYDMKYKFVISCCRNISFYQKLFF